MNQLTLHRSVLILLQAHLIDPAALACCSSHTIDDLERQILDHALDIAGSASSGKTSKSQENLMKEFVGDTIPARMRQIEAERAAEAEKRRQEAEEYQVSEDTRSCRGGPHVTHTCFLHLAGPNGTDAS